MSTLEKFGILVILILVVVIGVVAVWGVGGGEEGINPFGDGNVATAPGRDPGAAPIPPVQDPLPPWPDAGAAKTSVPPATDPVAPPPVKAPVTPPVTLTPTPPPPAVGTHTVQKGETLSSIAKKHFGDSSKWTAIRDANPGLNPNTLQVGQVLRLPGSGASAATAPAPGTRPVNTLFDGVLNPDDGPSMETRTPAGGKEYVVQKGDTLSAIAAEFYGSSAKWHRLVEANPGLDPRKLRPGMRIMVPAAE